MAKRGPKAKDDEIALRAMADLVVGREIRLPGRGNSSGIERAAGMVAEAMGIRTTTDQARWARRYGKDQGRLERGARHRLRLRGRTRTILDGAGWDASSLLERHAEELGGRLADRIQETIDLVSRYLLPRLRAAKSTHELADVHERIALHLCMTELFMTDTRRYFEK